MFHDRELQMIGGLIRILREREVPTEIALLDAAGKSRTDILTHFSEPDAVQILDNLPQDKVLDLFQDTDVVVFTSEFESARNRLAEAMGRGCVPVVMNGQSGPHQLIRDSENGFILPATAIEALADRLIALQRDVRQRRQMSSNAHDTAGRFVYPCAEMIEDYIDIFAAILDQSLRPVFKRPSAQLKPPPASVNGVDIFPVELSCNVEGVGLFPAQSPDYAEFKAQMPVRKFKLFRRDILARALGKL
jgi:hypothetical protein